MTHSQKTDLDLQVEEALSGIGPAIERAVTELELRPDSKLERKLINQLIFDHIRDNSKLVRPVPAGGHNKLNNFYNPTSGRSIGKFDLTLEVPGGIALGEVKWSQDDSGPGVIFEQAWDAIKLAIAVAEHRSVVRGYLFCGASAAAWRQGTTAGDLFETGQISPIEIWQRRIDPSKRGPNGGETIGEDLELGGGSRIFNAPEYLGITALEPVEMRFTGYREPWLLKVAAVEPVGNLKPWPLPHLLPPA